jgi:hypothetical protein
VSHVYTGDKKNSMWAENIECFSRKLVIEPGLDGLKYICCDVCIQKYSQPHPCLMLQEKFMQQQLNEFEQRHNSNHNSAVFRIYHFCWISNQMCLQI